MKQTLTYAVKFLPTPEQELLLFRTCKTFIDACGTVSEWCRENHCLSQKKSAMRCISGFVPNMALARRWHSPR